MDQAADLVLTGGEVLVVDEEFSVAQALAVRGGVIAAVGQDREVAGWIGPRTRVIDLAGQTLLPGINDSHVHCCAFGLSRPPLALDLAWPAVTSIAGIRAAVAQAASRSTAGQWIVGSGWDTGYLAECLADPGRQPDRSDLDPVSPANPACLQDFTGHVTWANSAALALARVGPGTLAPPGGVIGRAPGGQPTGLLTHAAQDLVQRLLPAPDLDRRKQAIRAAVALLHSEGITSLTEPGLGPGGDGVFGGASGTQTLAAYAELARAGELGARVSVLWLPSGMSGARDSDVLPSLAEIPDLGGADPRRLQLIGMKVFADGTPPSHTSWMYEDYCDVGGRGRLCVHGADDGERAGQLAEIIRLGHAAGYQVGVHVTGDRAIDAVVGAFEQAVAAHPRQDPRHYVIHGDFVTAPTLGRLARGGFGINMNPAIKWMAGDLMEPIIGATRSSWQWPARAAGEAGVRVMSSSDAPVTYPSWRQGVAALMLRTSRASGRQMGRGQCVGLPAAIRAYTVNGAWQDFAETWKGSLRPGMAADLCAVSGSLLRTPPEQIPDLPVVLTVVGGEIVYERG